MNRRSSLATLLTLFLFASAFGQTPKVSYEQQSDQDDVVRITTNLVQIDAVVTDKKGQVVTDLTADDFEVYEDGRPQKITNFSFISTESAQPAKPSASPATDKTTAAVPTPPVRLQPGEVRRTIALVVDDLCLSWVSANYVRKALKKYLDEQMQSGDLVAVIRTAGGMGVLQQFTSDKRQLYAAVERVKWYPSGCNGIESFEPLNQGLEVTTAPNAPEDRNDKVDIDKDAVGIDSRTPSSDLNKFRVDTLAVGTLGALSYVVRGMKDLPGRKSVLLISDGFSLRSNEDSRRILDAVDRVTDLANRSSVVIYTMDAHGLATTNFTAADSTLGSAITGPSSGPNPPYNKSAEVAMARAAQLNDTQSGLIYLAKQTGGFPVINSNDLAGGIKRVMDDQRGYYLVGYRPEESTFDPKTGRRRFHQFSLKVKRPGLTVRTRKGFYGVPDESMEATALTRGQQLVKAIVSPFKTTGVDLRLTSLFGNDARTGSYMRSLLYINAGDLTFTEEADGWHKAVMDVMAITFGDNGQIVDEVNKTQTIRVRGETYKSVLKDGLVYFMNVPVKRAGAYQLRMAVRDTATERVGSASQFIEVPDLGKKRLTISGIVVNGYERKVRQNETQPAGAAATPSDAPDAKGAVSRTEGAQEEIDPQASAAVRRLRRGMVMNYGFVIYNAQLERATRRPQLQTQLRMFRDGKLVFTGRAQSLDTSRQLDSTRLIAGGGLQLGSDMTPGEYVLQIVVTDLLAKEKNRTATQWIDFEIVK